MRSGAAAGHTGYFHETALYASDDELLGTVVPFVEDGRAAGEPVILVLDEGHRSLVDAAIGDTTGVEILAAEEQYVRPARTIAAFRERLGTHVAAGAEQIRVVGEVPHPGVGVPWEWWARYEAAVNHALADLPLWGICPYDTRTTPETVLAEVALTHPHVATPDGRHHANERFEDPADFLLRRARPQPDPLEALPPAIDLVEPTPAAVRAAVGALAMTTSLSPVEIEDLLIAASEVVANTLRHGTPPATVRAWAEADRVLLAVSDRGQGPDDPFAGLVPRTPGAHGGFGLWIAHQLCTNLSFDRGDDGFTARLEVRAGGRTGTG
jgi:anti-sigma regulatory factor (Ser/Thr protein kinase)